jgi:hypothetical protein
MLSRAFAVGVPLLVLLTHVGCGNGAKLPADGDAAAMATEDGAGFDGDAAPSSGEVNAPEVIADRDAAGDLRDRNPSDAIGDDARDGSTGDAAVASSPSAFCREYDRLYELDNFHCLGGLGSPPPSELFDCERLDASLASGRIAFVASSSSSCLTELERLFSVRCYPPARCARTVVQGLVSDGSTCSHQWECGPDSECLAPENACGPRTCQRAWLSPGSTGCFSNTVPPCPWGQFCAGGETATSQCRDEKPGVTRCLSDTGCLYATEFCDPISNSCKPRLGLGTSCERFPDACAWLTRCDLATNTCVAAGTIGDACGSAAFCWGGMCDSVPNRRAPGTCIPRVPAGGPCPNGAYCASNVCANGICEACP